MSYRFAFDAGTNSLGWSVLELDSNQNAVKIEALGVRIYPDSRNPKDKSSLAVVRRMARQMRRRRDRFLDRQAYLMQTLIEFALMPADEAARKEMEKTDPYDLRRKGLDHDLTAFELGRALFHLNQRRGFKSNRKTNKEEEGGKIKSGAARLDEAMKAANARTLGEFLAQKHDKREGVRARISGVGAKASYDFYPQRHHYEAEFDLLTKRQTPLLSDESLNQLRKIIFHQRDLKPVKAGKCAFDPTDERAPLALPSAQAFRLLQALADLRIIMPDRRENPLSMAERNQILALGRGKKEISFKGMRKALKLDDRHRFSHESEKRDKLLADETAHCLAHADNFGKAWLDLPLARQDEIVERLLAEEDEEKLISWLVESCKVTEKAAEEIANCSLPDGHLRLGRRALTKLLPLMANEESEKRPGSPIDYSEAAEKSFGHHSDFRTGEIWDELPDYREPLEKHIAFGSGDPNDPDDKRLGRISNPTVHVALNQMRKVVNALIDRYGRPEEIVVEVARDLKNSVEKRKEIDKDQAEKQKANNRRRAEIAAYFNNMLPENVSGRDVLKMRLWEEQGPVHDRRCPYTGNKIEINQLLSDATEIDHILPFSESLDDSAANKVVVFRSANRAKAGRSPFDAFGTSQHGYDWEKIAFEAAKLPRNKAWRFAPDAMEKIKKDDDFLARHLNDTRYLSRLASEYLACVCPKVWTVPGTLTGLLRGKLGLNSMLSDDNFKNRDDHRHHALDACIIGLTDRSLLQRVATVAASAESQNLDRLLGGLGDPWPNFRDEVRQALQRIVVAHKPTRSPKGGLHNATAYGLADQEKEIVVHRVPLLSLERKDIETDMALREEIGKPYDKSLRERLLAAFDEGKKVDEKLADTLARFAEEHNVRSLRLYEKLAVIPIKDRKTGKAYKGYKGDSNAAFQVHRLANGKWKDCVLSTFDANQPNMEPPAELGPPLMKLCKNDLLYLEEEGEKKQVFRVVKFGSGSIVLAKHTEGGSLKARDADKDDPFKYTSLSADGLRKRKARQIHVDPIGRIHDPGFVP